MSSSAAVASVLSNSDIPVDILTADLSSDPEGVTQRKFQIRNRGSSGLVTLVTNWTIIHDDPKSPRETTVTNIADSYDSGKSFANSGEIAEVFTHFRAYGAGVTRVIVAIAYAEFEDGTIIEGVPSCTHDSMFRAQRERVRAEYADLLAKYSAGAFDSDSGQQVVYQYPRMVWFANAVSERGLKPVIEQIKSSRFFSSGTGGDLH